MTKDTPIAATPLPLWGSLILFGTPTLVMWLATRFGIPALRPHLNGPDILCWFVAGGTVFFGLFASAFVAFWIEQGQITLTGFAGRFRLLGINVGDVAWSVGALIVCGLLSAGIAGAWRLIAQTWGLIPVPSLTPSFIRVEPLAENRASIVLAWLPLFFFNITGEELWWRGYVLPRQEREHPRAAWLAHGCGLTLFHLPLGVDLSIILLPFLFGLPLVVQRRKNLWTGFMVHGILNGGGFLAVVAGLA